MVASVYNAIKDDDSDQIVVCTWLCLEHSDGGAIRLSVRAGDAPLGYLSEKDFAPLRGLVERAQARRRAVWVDAFIALQENRYHISVSLPVARPAKATGRETA